MSNNWIPEDLYQKVLEYIPIICVDLIIISDNEFLLGKRINEPAKGQWFVPGGRVLKREKLIDAVKRKTKEEVGLNIQENDIELVTVGETIFTEGEDRHSVNIVYKINLKDKEDINFDQSQTSEVKWFSRVDNDWHPYLKQILKVAGF